MSPTDLLGKELLSTDEIYTAGKDDWAFWKACYGGTQALIKYGILSDFDDIKTIRGAVTGYNYSRRIIEATSGFITRYTFDSAYGALNNDILFKAFLANCDLTGVDFENWFNCVRSAVCTYGYVGIMVTQPTGGSPSTLEERLIYPYLSYYTPLAILKRKYERDPFTAVPRLTYIKLKQENPDTILEYSLEEYKTWGVTGDGKDYIQIPGLSGTNTLGSIPFVFWAIEPQPGKLPETGMSLLTDIGLIDASLVRSAARMDFLEHVGCFPMYIRPKPKKTLADPAKPVKEVAIGPKAVQEFDPETPHAKPYWLAPEIAAAITPMLEVWERKKTEMYELSYLAPVLESQGKEPRSGEALAQLFELLYARLSAMAKCEAESRMQVIKLWTVWQNKTALLEKVKITHKMLFKTSVTVTNIVDVKTEKEVLAGSETAVRELNKRVVGIGTLADIPQPVKDIIFAELDKEGLSKPEPVVKTDKTEAKTSEETEEL